MKLLTYYISNNNSLTTFILLGAYSSALHMRLPILLSFKNNTQR